MFGKMSIDEAHSCAARYATEKAWPDRDGARELRSGWYFPWRFSGEPLIGSNGIIVDKQTGRAVLLGSAYPLERDLRAYDAGYPLTPANLIVNAVADQELTDAFLNNDLQFHLHILPLSHPRPRAGRLC